MRLTLHKERKNNVSASVELVVGLVLRADRLALQSSSRGHRVLSADTDTIDELSPGVADDPALKRSSPRCGQHDETD